MQERGNGELTRLTVPEDLRPRVEQLREFRLKHGLKAALFDLDNTLSDTTSIFDRQEKKFMEKCFLKLGREASENTIREGLELFNEERERLYLIHGFNFPILWPHIAEAVARKYSSNGIDLSDCLTELEEILRTKPNPMPGATDALDDFASAGFKRGLVTHASPEWTAFKLEALGMAERFDSITLAPTNRFKGPEDWKAAVDALGIKPEEAIAVGDSIVGDMQAAYQAGIKLLVHVPPNHAYFAKGELPPGALTSLGIGNVVDVLLGMGKIEIANV